jgi:outer membrane protein OmpA-like peptidoglycan-associated protein
MLKQIIPLAVIAALASCALPANVVVLVPDEGGIVGKLLVAKDGARDELAGPYAAVGTDANRGDEKVFVADRQAVESAFSSALAAKPRPPAFFTIFFVVGQADINPDSADTLRAAVAASVATRNADISVVGHSDATGDDADNQSLSQRRARAIRDVLVAGGVRPSIIELSYHGSHNPLVPAPNGVSEPRNRRVEVTIR